MLNYIYIHYTEKATNQIPCNRVMSLTEGAFFDATAEVAIETLKFVFGHVFLKHAVYRYYNRKHILSFT